jgi:hypothetical protein
MNDIDIKAVEIEYLRMEKRYLEKMLKQAVNLLLTYEQDEEWYDQYEAFCDVYERLQETNDAHR